MNIVEPIKSTETLREIENYLGRSRKKRRKRNLLLFVMLYRSSCTISAISTPSKALAFGVTLSIKHAITIKVSNFLNFAFNPRIIFSLLQLHN